MLVYDDLNSTSTRTIHTPTHPHTHTPTLLTGPAVVPSYIAALIKLTRKARRFFPPGAVREIINHLAPDLAKAPAREGFMAQGMLVLLLPCCALRGGCGGTDGGSGVLGTDAHVQHSDVTVVSDDVLMTKPSLLSVDSIWSTVLPMVLTSWALVTHCPWWDSLWLGFLARYEFLCWVKYIGDGIQEYMEYRGIEYSLDLLPQLCPDVSVHPFACNLSLLATYHCSHFSTYQCSHFLNVSVLPLLTISTPLSPLGVPNMTPQASCSGPNTGQSS